MSATTNVEFNAKTGMIRIDDGLLSLGVGDKKYTAANRRITRRFLRRVGLEPKTYIQGAKGSVLQSAIAKEKTFIAAIEGDKIVALHVKAAPKPAKPAMAAKA